jgi:3',5'-cyclic AMP phosphodiesterase CpdA
MSLVLQISDTHFGTEVGPVVTALRKLAREQQPRIVIWSGDITQRARHAQFAAAAEFARELGKSAQHVLVIPGNHDIPLFDVFTRFSDPYANYARAFGRMLEPSYESDQLLVQCVNTTRWWRRKHGEIAEEQIERVATRLRNAGPDQLRIVVTHQPLQAIRESDLNNLLRGYELAARTWSAAGVDILMGGHIHLPYVRQLRASLRASERHTWVVQAGTALSKRIREGVPNSINLIRSVNTQTHAPTASCAIERWDFNAATEQFGLVENHQLPLTRELASQHGRTSQSV